MKNLISQIKPCRIPEINIVNFIVHRSSAGLFCGGKKMPTLYFKHVDKNDKSHKYWASDLQNLEQWEKGVITVHDADINSRSIPKYFRMDQLIPLDMRIRAVCPKCSYDGLVDHSAHIEVNRTVVCYTCRQCGHIFLNPSE